MEAVGDKCKTRRHDVDFKQWIQYYDAYSVKRSSSRRVLLYVYAVFVGLFAVPVFVKLCLYILFIDELFNGGQVCCQVGFYKGAGVGWHEPRRGAFLQPQVWHPRLWNEKVSGGAMQGGTVSRIRQGQLYLTLFTWQLSFWQFKDKLSPVMLVTSN